MENLADLISTANSLKNNNDIKGLNKNEAIQYSIQETNNFKKLITALFDKENGIIVNMQRQIADQQSTNMKLLTKMNNLEKQQIQIDQYSRKETIDQRFGRDHVGLRDREEGCGHSKHNQGRRRSGIFERRHPRLS